MNIHRFGNYGGFILAFEPQRTGTIRLELEEERSVFQTFSSLDWDFERRELVLLILARDRKAVCGAALMERANGRKSGTGECSMRLFAAVLFEDPIEPYELALEINDIISLSINLIRIAPERWTYLLNAVTSLRPYHAAQIWNLEEMRLRGPMNLPLGVRGIEQRDAINLALEIAGLKRSDYHISNETNFDTAPNSVLEFFRQEPMHEQDAIRHDQRIFKDLLSSAGAIDGRFAGASGQEVIVRVYDKKTVEHRWESIS